MKRIEFVAVSADVGKRLDVFIAEASQAPDSVAISRSQVKQLFEKGLITVNSAIADKISLKMTEGNRVSVSIPPAEKLDLKPHDVGIRILFEDEHLAVLEKPAGISTHPSSTETSPTVVHGLLGALSSLSSVGGTERPGIVHRIDKGTSGILVVSKTDVAHLGLSAQFKAHTVARRYRALVYGKPKTTSGRIETFFGRSSANRKKMTGKLTSGRKAITHWSTTELFEAPLTLVECRLETGRTHQIRVHLSEIGYALVGDATYGEHLRQARALTKHFPSLAHACIALTHQLLHAYLLGFEHPVTRKHLEFQSELPADFQDVLTLARGVL